MKQIFFRILLSFFLILFTFNNSFANKIYFIDFSKVLNQSKAGNDAQEKLKDKFLVESKKFDKEAESIKKEENELISQKKILSNDEYKKKVDELRKRVAKLQADKQNSLNNIAKARANAKVKLLNSVNPILKKYMETNEIQIVLDKQGIVLGDVNLEITDEIIKLLNQEVNSIKID